MNQLHLQSKLDRLFASSPDGGLWVSDTDTANWVPIADFLDNIEVRAFGVSDRVDLDVIYLVNKRSSLYKSSDVGATWKKVSTLGASFGRVSKIIVYDPSTLYMATTTGLYRSIDSGVTWRQLIPADVRDFEFEPGGTSIIYAGVRSLGIYKSSNGGVSWTRILGWNDPETVVNCCVPERTTPSQNIRISLGERRANGLNETSTNRTVAVKFGRHVWISRNGGGTFTNRDSALITGNGAGNYQRSEDHNDGDWCNTIAVDPWNSDRILVGQSSLFITIDAGVTWTEFNTSADAPNRFRHEDFQDIVFSRTTRDLIFAANDGGVEKSTVPNPTFNTFYTNLATSQLFRAAVRVNTVVANSDHNGLLGTTNITGGSWGQVVSSACSYGNNGMERSDVYADPKRPGRFYFFSDVQRDGVNFPPQQLGRVNFPYLSGNNCVNNASVFFPFRPFLVYGFPEKPQQPIAVDTRSGSELILAASDVPRANCNDWNICPQGAGNTYNLMMTRDGNTEPTGDYAADDPTQPTWEVTAQSVDDPFVSVAFINRPQGKNAYAITRSGALYTASIPLPLPVMINWTRQDGFVPPGGEGVRHFAPLAADENTVFAITRNSFAKTSDGGATWTVQNNPVPASSLYSIALRGNFIGGTDIYVGASDGIYKRVGFFNPSFTKWSTGLPNVKVVQLVQDSIFMYAVTFGRGLWRISMAQNFGTTDIGPVYPTANPGSVSASH